MSLISLKGFLLTIEGLKQQLLEQNRNIRKVIGQSNHGPDYTGSCHVARRQYLMRTITPELKTVEQPVEFLDRQNDRLVGGIWRYFEAVGRQALELNRGSSCGCPDR